MAIIRLLLIVGILQFYFYCYEGFRLHQLKANCNDLRMKVSASGEISRRESFGAAILFSATALNVQTALPCKAEDSGVREYSIVFSAGPIGLELQDNPLQTTNLCSTIIKRIIPGSQAAQKSSIQVGFGILSVNGQAVVGMKAKEVLKVISSAQRPVTLTFQDTSAVLNGGAQQRLPVEEELYVRTLSKPEVCGVRSKRGDLIEINYTGRYRQNDAWFEFDSSAKRGTGLPYSFVLGNGEVIKGLDLSLNEMCIGEVRLIKIPAGLAYGQKGSKVFKIPPDTSLSYLVELVSVNFVTDTASTRGDNFYTGDVCDEESIASGTASGRCKDFQK
mmetsp:Transcript_6713/g.9073  ORF Transcript_6713/g.9073 Transcript_6713/m.9073 type:complete len:332 (+) Transcript_6713:64-1059(+)